MIKILFICHGNICRSPMAEFVMKELVRRGGDAKRFKIASCAVSREELGNDIHCGTRRKLLEAGIPFEKRQTGRLRGMGLSDCDGHCKHQGDRADHRRRSGA